MTSEQIADKLYNLKFAVDVSSRYHAHRISTIKLISGCLETVELVASTSALVSTFYWSTTVTRSILFLAMLSGGLTWLQRTAKAIEFHYNQKAKFAGVAVMFPADLEKGTEEQLGKIEHMRAEIETPDTNGFQCLDILCHNEECQARGQRGGIKPMTWFQQHIGTWLIPIRYIEK